jgi:hypothetical protein
MFFFNVSELASKLALLQFDHIKKQEVLDMVTIEQVTKLREYADISFEEAKAALEETNGDILEAIVNLEKKGKINAPKGGGNYSTASEGDKTQQDAAGTGAKQQPEKDSASLASWSADSSDGADESSIEGISTVLRSAEIMKS